ncbi:Gp37-like protein [Nonomuraea candida]|uniref:Gp37-like protein n=1 Tax=Nonomuraea candida TaxID=359159 RepID=UPI0005B9C78B|nr:hypothetical protein [Nonomuraea candida]
MRNFRIYVRESLFPRSKAEGGDGLPPLAIVGEADAYLSFDAIMRHNTIGSWSLKMPADHLQSRMLKPGRGIVVYQDGEKQPLFSGPIRQIEKEWDESNPGAGSVTVSGVDDNYLLAERLAWTNPSQDIRLAAAYQHWQADPNWPNVAELLRQLFLANAQGQALRRLDRLFIPDAGSTVNFLHDETARVARLKFDQADQLTALLSAVYGFRITFVWHPDPASTGASNGDPDASGPGILMRLEQISDMTNEIQFGAEMGNLRGYKYLVKAPEATRLVIATQNRTWREFQRKDTFDEVGNKTGYTEEWVEKSGPERWFGYMAADEYDPEWWGDPEETPLDKQHTLAWAAAGFTATETEWGVTAERYKDRRDVAWPWLQDPAKPAGWALDPPVWSAQWRALQDEMAAFNLEAGPKAAISIDPMETGNTMFGRDYGLGDLVRVHIDGEVRDEIVREVRLSSGEDDGPRVKPTIGTFGTSETPYLYAQIRSLWDRVSGVEARENLQATFDDVPTSDFVLRKAA